MDSGSQSAARTQLASPVKRMLGPRPMIITGAALAVLAVVAVLAQLVLSSQDASRNAAAAALRRAAPSYAVS